jgi:hypothetical protein
MESPCLNRGLQPMPEFFRSGSETALMGRTHAKEKIGNPEFLQVNSVSSAAPQYGAKKKSPRTQCACAE